MKTYKLVVTKSQLGFPDDSVYVEATDYSVVEQLRADLVNLLQSRIPTARVTKPDPLLKGMYRLWLTHLEDKQGACGELYQGWITRWLCEHGWEPFAVIYDYRTMYFRQEIDE